MKLPQNLPIRWNWPKAVLACSGRFNGQQLMKLLFDATLHRRREQPRGNIREFWNALKQACSVAGVHGSGGTRRYCLSGVRFKSVLPGKQFRARNSGIRARPVTPPFRKRIRGAESDQPIGRSRSLLRRRSIAPGWEPVAIVERLRFSLIRAGYEIALSFPQPTVVS